MNEVKDILNIVGDFKIHLDNKSIEAQGTLLKNQNVVLHGRISHEELGSLADLKRSRITGIVDGIRVTLINPIITYNIRRRSIGKGVSTFDYIQIFAEPTEIIIGRWVYDEGNVIAAEMDLPELNWFFRDKVFDDSIDSELDPPVLLRYRFPEIISVEDEDGRLKINRRLNLSSIFTDPTFSSIPFIRFEFVKAVPFRSAVKQIAKVRNLFLFFSNDYLPLRDISLADERSNTFGSNASCDFILVLNDKHEEKAPCSRPFYVKSNDVIGDFNNIWKEWCDLNNHKFIVGLFYQIISDRSIWINRFLNFSQAIELYERTYRLSNLEKANKNRPYFKSCISDAMIQLKEPLELEENRIEELAVEIRDARNYFTHYNPEIREPSIEEVFAMGRILHLVFLGLIYKRLGLNQEILVEIKRGVEFRNFNNDVKIAMQEEVLDRDYFV